MFPESIREPFSKLLQWVNQAHDIFYTSLNPLSLCGGCYHSSFSEKKPKLKCWLVDTGILVFIWQTPKLTLLTTRWNDPPSLLLKDPQNLSQGETGLLLGPGYLGATLHPGSGTAIFCPSTYFPSQDASYADDAFTQVRGSNLCPWPGPHAVSRGSERTSWAELLHLGETRDPDKESPKVSPDILKIQSFGGLSFL